MLACTDLTLRRGGRPVLRGVTAGFAAGAVTVIIGPNGAGKSSLLAALAGLVVPDSGRVLLNGAPLAGISRQARARAIGYLPQARDVHWDIDAAALVALGRLPHRGVSSRADDIAAVATAMAACDVTAFRMRPVMQLSGGEQARVLLARVLAGQPDWLLADEPLAALDPAHQWRTLAVLRTAASGSGPAGAAGAGVVAVMHDLALAAQVADRLLLLADGRVLADGSPDEVLTPALLAAAFDISADVSRNAAGQLIVTQTGLAQVERQQSGLQLSGLQQSRLGGL